MKNDVAGQVVRDTSKSMRWHQAFTLPTVR
jgi:hypothetical protein